MIWVIACAYAVITLLAARKILYAMRASEPAGDPADPMDAVLLGLLALFADTAWPLVVPVAAVMWKPRKTPAQLREEIAERDARIAELEREAGIQR